MIVVNVQNAVARARFVLSVRPAKIGHRVRIARHVNIARLRWPRHHSQW